MDKENLHQVDSILTMCRYFFSTLCAIYSHTFEFHSSYHECGLNSFSHFACSFFGTFHWKFAQFVFQFMLRNLFLGIKFCVHLRVRSNLAEAACGSSFEARSKCSLQMLESLTTQVISNKARYILTMNKMCKIDWLSDSNEAQ